MQLYAAPFCPFGHRAVFALRAKEVPFELILFDPRAPRPAALADVSSRARSPTLIDGDVAVYESLVVLEYVEERYPDRPLLPAAPVQRAEARMLITRFVEELAPKLNAVAVELFFRGAVDPERAEAAKRDLFEALPAWDAHFDGRTWASGDDFSLADIVLFTLFPSIERLTGVGVPEGQPHLRAWLDRVASQPGAAVLDPEA